MKMCEEKMVVDCMKERIMLLEDEQGLVGVGPLQTMRDQWLSLVAIQIYKG